MNKRNQSKITHGLTHSKEWKSWQDMKARCYRKNHKSFAYYGGRGITVCERWLNSFENFLSDMGTKPTSKHSLDRIDVNGNYHTDNCRWANQTEQIRNRRKLRATKNKHKGIYLRCNGRYQVTLTIEGKSKSFGTFDTEQEAIKRHKEIYQEVYGDR